MKMTDGRRSSIKSEEDIKKELFRIFKEEFADAFNDILKISQSSFESQFKHRLNIILNSYHKNYYEFLRQNHQMFNDVYNQIIQEEYLPTKKLCRKVLNSSSKEILDQFHPHCSKNKNAIHTCSGVFFLIRDETTKNAKYVLCSKCKLVYDVNCILMHCPDDSKDFFSCYEKDPIIEYLPATWEKYHCGIMLNQQMTCIKCHDLLWIQENKLYCKKCNKLFEPKEIDWVCIKCKKIFHTEAKIYNPLEFKSMKLSVKNAIFYQKIIKPTTLPCKCDKNPLKLEFYHNEKCKGVLCEGNIFGSKIVVCSECKLFSSIAKFTWFCPKCQTGFKTQNVRTLPSVRNTFKDELGSGVENKISTKETRVHTSKETPVKTIKETSGNSNKGNNESIIKETPVNSISKILKFNLIKSVDDLNEEVLRSSRCITEGNDSNSVSRGNELINLAEKMKTKNKEKNERQKTGEIGIAKLINSNAIANDAFNLWDKKKKVDTKIKKSEPNHENLFEFPNSMKKSMELDRRENNNSQNNFLFRSAHLQKGMHNNSGKNQMNLSRGNYSLSLTPVATKDEHKQPSPRDFHFNLDDYEIKQQLGQGTFGTIFEVENIYNKNLFCMKNIIINNSRDIAALKNEYEIFSKYPHPNILKIYGVAEKPLDMTTFSFFILMEEAKTDWEKEIIERAKRKSFYTEKELINIMRQLIHALAFLQRNGVAHRDIKAQNVLVFDGNLYKIADFGEAKNMQKVARATSTLRGTELYMSPDLFNALQIQKFDVKHNAFKSDVFSLGMCLLFAATLNINNLSKIRNFTDNAKVQLSIVNAINLNYSFGILGLLSKMLCVSEEGRPDFIELEDNIKNYQI